MRRGLQAFLLALLLVAPALAQDSFVRLQRDKAGKARALQTAIVRMKSRSGQVVDLVAVTHVADKAYYQKLSKHLGANYQCVLYEMVLDIPKSVAHQNRMRELIGREKKQPVIDTSKSGNDPVSTFQLKLASLLGLEFQLPLINYNQPNFVHADLTLEEFNEAMTARAETPASLLKKLFTTSASSHDTPEEKAMARLPLLKIIASGPTPAEQKVLKAGMAADFSDLTDTMQSLEGSALLADRNQRVMDVLKQRIGRGDTKIAIFYGAAHMADFRSRLQKMGWKRVSTDWLSAWKL